MELIQLNISLVTVSFGLGALMAFFISLVASLATRKRGSAYYGIDHD